MANYQAPTPLFIRMRTGLNRFIERFDPEDIDAKLRQLRGDVEAEVQENVTAAVWTSGDLTAAQALLLKRAVALRTAAAYLISPAVQKLTGTQEPLLMGKADEILDFADRLEEKAGILEGKLGTGAVEGTFALPYVKSSTYDSQATVWDPATRIHDLDERDDVPAGTLLRNQRPPQQEVLLD